ncbi:hypothetical protein [Anaerovorax sp. IOR16]|uniref:hypothetical protein n=1 Tax=Anaerovorax sp. IOR16 TaxID=2773458 RepID=UPI0019D22668|nr:hypothetical protein [Anaerovorax sp. IOR16]
MDGGMMKDEIKALGKLITCKLNLQDDYDVMNKWMITYIAEQMHRYEIAKTDEEKQIAGEKCSDAIMKFWKHRSYNSGWNPLEKYKQLLERINRMVSNEFGVDIINFIGSGSVEDGDLAEKTKIIRKVNNWLIEDMIFEELGEVRDLDDNPWIDIIDDLGDPDAGVIRLVAGISEERNNTDNQYIKYRIERIELVISLLNEFAKSEYRKLND